MGSCERLRDPAERSRIKDESPCLVPVTCLCAWELAVSADSYKGTVGHTKDWYTATLILPHLQGGETFSEPPAWLTGARSAFPERSQGLGITTSAWALPSCMCPGLWWEGQALTKLRPPALICTPVMGRGPPPQPSPVDPLCLPRVLPPPLKPWSQSSYRRVPSAQRLPG